MDAPAYWSGWDTRAAWAVAALFGAATWHAFLLVALTLLTDWRRSR